MANLGLVGLNKCFLYAPVGLTGSTHNARLLKESSIYTEILDGDIMPDKDILFADFGEIPLFTIGGSAFPQYTWRFLYKKTECRHFNLRYVIVASAALHSICIERSDPCQPSWRLEIEQLELMEKPLFRAVDKEESNLIRMKISSWVWMDH